APHSVISFRQAQYSPCLGLNFDYRVFFDTVPFQIVRVHVRPVEWIFLSRSRRIAIRAVQGFKNAAGGQAVFEASVGLFVQHDLQLSGDVWWTELQSCAVVLRCLDVPRRTI